MTISNKVYRVNPPASTVHEPVRCSVVSRVPPSDLRPWTGMPSYTDLKLHDSTDMLELKRVGRELGSHVSSVQFTMYQIYNNVIELEGVSPPCAPNVEIDMSLKLSDVERLQDGFHKTLEEYNQWCSRTMSILRDYMNRNDDTGKFWHWHYTDDEQEDDDSVHHEG